VVKFGGVQLQRRGASVGEWAGSEGVNELCAAVAAVAGCANGGVGAMHFGRQVSSEEHEGERPQRQQEQEEDGLGW
jgi:hypothetical protein